MFFGSYSCKVLRESLAEAYRIITSMPMFATYRVKVEMIISEVLWRFCENQEHENFVLFRCRNVSPIFCWSSKFVLLSPSKLPVCRERGNSCLNRITSDFRSTLGVSTVEALMCISINGVVSLEHYH